MAIDIGAIVGKFNFRYESSKTYLMSFVDFQIMNVAKVTDGLPQDAAERVLQKLAESLVKLVYDAEKKLEMPFGGSNPQSSEFGVQPLRPQNMSSGTANQIGYTNESRWQWTSGGSATNKWAAEDTMVNFTLDKDELMDVFGYFNNEAVPNTIELFIQPGATKLPIYNIEQMRALGTKPRVILFEPIIVEASSAFIVKCATRTISLAEDAGFLGWFAAPTSKLLTETY